MPTVFTHGLIGFTTGRWPKREWEKFARER